MKSPLRWVGGKNAEAEYLVGLLPAHSCYVEVFGGGASVLLAKRPSDVEVYNDLNGELVNFFRVLRERPAEFKAMWKWCVISREEFNTLRDADLYTLTPLERAYRFIYINRACFAGEMQRPVFGISATQGSTMTPWLDSLDEWVDGLHQRLRCAYIEHLSWSDLIPKYDKPNANGVFFLDPPYFETREYATGTLTEDDHRALASTLGKVHSRFLLTINDHPLVRSLYDGCHVLERTKQYSISKSTDARREYAELIISNYELPATKQATFL